MPITVAHVKSVTIPDGATTEIVRPSDWNSNHAITYSPTGQEIIGAFSNEGNVSFGTNPSGYITASAPAGGGINYVFSNSNGVSFGTNGSTVTATVATNYQSQGAYLTTAAQSDHTHGSNISFQLTGVQASATSNSAGLTMALSANIAGGGDGFNPAQFSNSTANTTMPLVWAGNSNGSGNVTMGLTGSTVTMSAPSGGAGDGYNIIGVNGGATQLSTTYQFNNGNNVSFGLNAGTITASASYPAQSADNNKAGTGFTTTTAAGVVVAGTNDTNGLKLAVPAYITTYANDLTSGRAGTGFTSASTAGSDIVATLNTNGLSVGVPKYLTTTVAQSVQPVAYSAANGSANFSTLSFANSNGVSFSTGTQGVYATVATNYQSQGAYLTTARASNDAIGLNTAITANGVSVTANSSGLSLNFPAFLTTAAQSSASNVSGVLAGTASNGGTATLSGNVSFSNANGVSFYTSAGNAVVATVRTDYLTTAMVSNAGSNFVAASAAFAGTNASGTIASNGISISVGAGGAADGYNSAQFTNSTANSTMPIVWAGNSNGSGNITIGLTGSTVTMSAPSGGPGGGVQIADSASTVTNNYVLFSNNGGVSFGLNGSTMTASVDHGNIGLSNVGNTAGNTRASDIGQGLVVFAGSGSITLSQATAGNSNTIYIQHPAWITTYAAQTNQSAVEAVGVVNAGNTAGNTGYSTGIDYCLAGSGSITLSQSTAAGSVTCWIQHPAWLTTAMASNASSTLAGTGTTLNGTNLGVSATLNSNGLRLDLNNTDNHLQGWSLYGNTSGTTQTQYTTVGGLYLAGGNNITVSGNSNSITISAAALGGTVPVITRQSFDNLGPLGSVQGAMGTKAVVYRSLSFFPLKPFADIFNGSMTVNTLGIDMSITGSTATNSGALSTTAYIGLYTINTTAATLSLGLINSVAMTWGYAAAATNNSTGWVGQRYMTVHSSQWSSQPVLSDGVQYVMGLVYDSGGASSNQSNTVMGGFFGSTAARSGFVGATPVAAATWQGSGQFLGHYSATTNGMPAAVNYTQIHKQSASGNFVPHIVGFNFTNGQGL